MDRQTLTERSLLGTRLGHYLIQEKIGQAELVKFTGLAMSTRPGM